MKEEAPSSWPAEARDLYKPLKPLGKGGFGTVWLAEQRTKEEGAGQDKYVAIKLVGHAIATKQNAFSKISEAGYYRREVEVLQEISHPFIVKLLQKIEVKAEQEKESSPEASPYCMVLSYCRGPTLEQSLKHGGACGIYLAREISTQLIDAVSFLHGRGVIHRDIKPDNIIINGAKLSGSEMWSDEIEGDDAAKANRWKIKLVDFGFARPLHPDDIDVKGTQERDDKLEPSEQFFGRSNIDGAIEEKVEKDSLSNSLTQKKIIGLSAVGNRNYAAPEMLKGIRSFSKKNVLSLSSSGSGHGTKNELEKKKRHEQSLADAISDYSMNADAYSVGTTIRFMLTGVPPDQSVNAFIAEKNSCMNILARKLKKAVAKDKDSIMKKRYRYTSQLPKEASQVVLGLTHWNERSRTTVRSARNFEWIQSSYTMKNGKEHPSSNNHHGEINFLKCALERRV